MERVQHLVRASACRSHLLDVQSYIAHCRAAYSSPRTRVKRPVSAGTAEGPVPSSHPTRTSEPQPVSSNKETGNIAGSNKNDSSSEQSGGDKGAASKRKSHMYYNMNPWSTKIELAEFILKSQVYNEGGLLVANKPYGVPSHQFKSRAVVTSFGVPLPARWSLEEVLPVMQEMLSVNYLQVVFAAERWSSGVLALSTTPLMSKRVKRCHSAAVNWRMCYRNNLVLTCGPPHPSSCDQTRAATRMVHVPGSNYKLPLLLEKFSNRQVALELVNSFHVRHRTLGINRDKSAALVQVEASNKKDHCHRVWLSHKLAAPLGDRLFGGRVATLLGRPVPVPFDRAVNKQNMTYEFLKQLELSPSTEDMLPLFCHLHSITLPFFLKKEKRRKSLKNGNDDAVPMNDLNLTANYLTVQDCIEESSPDEDASHSEVNPDGSRKRDPSRDFVIKVPLPEYFKWTIEKLGIRLRSEL